MNKDMFEYLPPTQSQVATMAEVRSAFTSLGHYIEQNVPEGPDRTYAMRLIRTAAMWANIAITRQPDGSPRK